MRTRIWHSDWKPRWLIRCVSAALLSFMDKQVSLWLLGCDDGTAVSRKVDNQHRVEGFVALGPNRCVDVKCSPKAPPAMALAVVQHPRVTPRHLRESTRCCADRRSICVLLSNSCLSS